MTDPISNLETHLGYWLRFVSNHVSHSFARRIEDQGVTVAEWAMLRALHGREPTQPSRIADMLGMTRGAISKLADRLLAKGMIDRTPDESDGRMHALALTTKGAVLVPALAAIADENDARFFGHLAPRDRALLEQMLRSIVDREQLKTIPVD